MGATFFFFTLSDYNVSFKANFVFQTILADGYITS